MIRKYVAAVQGWADGKLRRLCDRIAPEKRLTVLLILLGLFGAMSIYLFASAIYNLGKNEGRQLEIEHTKRLELRQRDSINQLKFNNDAREQE